MLGIFASAGNSKRSGESENARVVQFEILENLGNVPEPPFLHYSNAFENKSSQWLWNEKLCQCWDEPESQETHRCITDCHDMTIAVKTVLNSTANKQIHFKSPSVYC